MRARFNTQVDIETLIIPTLIQGAAVSCFFIPLITFALGGLRPDQIAAASGLNNFLRITAGAFATSIATTLWENRAACTTRSSPSTWRPEIRRRSRRSMRSAAREWMRRSVTRSSSAW